jgi:hypothetical protein
LHASSHRDQGEWAIRSHRVHVPIISQPGVTFKVTTRKRNQLGSVKKISVEVDISAGRVFEINNMFEHHVTHRGKGERIHLLIDYSEIPLEYYRLRQGLELSYQDVHPQNSSNFPAVWRQLERG